MNWQRLSDLVLSRRIQLGFRTREALSQSSGLSHRTLSYIERFERDSYSRSTLAQLEQALHWLPGSVDRVLSGGDPEPIQEPPPALPEPLGRLVAAYGALPAADRAVLAAALVPLVEWAEDRTAR